MNHHLIREYPGSGAHSAEAAREYIRSRVESDLKVRGEPRPILAVVWTDYVDVLDLTMASQSDPGASPGQTLRMLAGNAAGAQTFLVLGARLQREDGAARRFALVVHRYRQGETEMAWVGWLPFELDAGGPARIEQDWEVFEAPADSDGMDPMMQALLCPASSERAWTVMPPIAGPIPVTARMGRLDGEVPVPDSARKLTDLVAALTVSSLVSGEVNGLCVVRTSGREHEFWALDTDRFPASIDEIVRALVNREAHPPDGVGIAQLACFNDEEAEAPEYGVQIIVEQAGERAERRIYLESAPGVGVEPQFISDRIRDLPAPADQGWIGVESPLDLNPAPLVGLPEA